MTQKSRESIQKSFEGKGYGDLKIALAEVIIESLRPIRENYQKIYADKAFLEQILTQGVEKVRPIARKTYQKAKECVGLI